MHWKTLSLLHCLSYEYIRLSLLKKTIYQSKSKSQFLQHVSKSARKILDRLNVQVECKGSPKGNGVFVCNHLSYLDPLIIFSQLNGVFVTSTDVYTHPVLGRICRLTDCIFINRNNGRHIANDLKQITEKLDQGFNVIVFPEATSTDGKTILPFKPWIFQIAYEFNVPVYPICLKYTKLNQKIINNYSQSIIHYYGEHKFFPHLLKLSKQESISAKLRFLEGISATHFLNRKVMAKTSRELISKEYVLN